MKYLLSLRGFLNDSDEFFKDRDSYHVASKMSIVSCREILFLLLLHNAITLEFILFNF